MSFIDLHRHFVPLDKDKEPNLEIGSIWGGKYAGWLGWAELLERRRVVLLAEAASGKSEEFRSQAETLTRSGRPAFFVPIGLLADSGLATSLGADAERLQDWLRGTEDGYFFLDAVDEAKLNRRSFDLALKRLGQETGVPGLTRSHIFVSCRASDWSNRSDRRAFETNLPVPPPRPELPILEDLDAALLRPIFDRKEQSGTVEEEKQLTRLDELLVVQLVPLQHSQRRQLAASAVGANNVDAFIEAVDQTGLTTLAERPGDLLELAVYWKDHEGFASLEKMTAHGVAGKLAEIDRYRPDNDLLSAEMAKHGAERLAVALTLGKSFTLRAPGYEPDPTLAAGAVDPASVLTDWTEGQINALLRRGIFTPATYGRLRFHHRSTQEYLAAQWMDGLLQADCRMADIFSLLFAECFGVATVIPSMRPVAAWLALKHDAIRNEIVRREPLVLLRHGDPGSLPIETRKNLLHIYAEKQKAGEIADDSIDHRALWMFAHPELAGAIREAWLENPTPEFRSDLLRLIREGRLTACAGLARVVAEDATQNDYHRVVAVKTMQACGDREGCHRVAQRLIAQPEGPSARLASRLAVLLFPRDLDVDQMIRLIARSRPPRRGSGSGFESVIEELYEACPEGTAREGFIGGIATLCLKGPFAAAYHRISNCHRELAEQLEPIARKEVERVGKSAPSAALIKLLMVVERAKRNDVSQADELSIRALVGRNQTLQCTLFWKDVAAARREAKGERLSELFDVLPFGIPLWNLDLAALPWLTEDLERRRHPDDRRIALNAAAVTLRDAPDRVARFQQLRALVAGQAELENDLKNYRSPRREDRQIEALLKREEKRKKKTLAQEALDKASWKRFRVELQTAPDQLKDPLLLAKWKHALRLRSLLNWLEKRTGKHNEDAALHWPLLSEGFGLEVAEAFRDGMKALWRIVAPEAPRREPGQPIQTKWTTILSFAGLGIEAQMDGWASRLSPDEAQRAAEHGCFSDQGYPDWAGALLEAHPAVGRIFQEQVRHEWSAPTGSSRSFLYRFADPSQTTPPALNSALEALLGKGEPPDMAAFDLGLRIASRMNLTIELKRELVRSAEARLEHHDEAGDDDWALRYLATLLLLDIDRGVSALASWLEHAPAAKRQARQLSVFSAIFGRHQRIVGLPLGEATTSMLERLAFLAVENIRPEQDNIRDDGSYTPNVRDNAEDGRSAVIGALLERPEADAYWAVRRLSEHPYLAMWARRYRELSRGMAERATEMPA